MEDKKEARTVPVKTAGEIPKEKIWECMAQIRKARARAPICVGDVLIENVAGTSVAVVATGNVPAKGQGL